jgi:hypothetical protein
MDDFRTNVSADSHLNVSEGSAATTFPGAGVQHSAAVGNRQQKEEAKQPTACARTKMTECVHGQAFHNTESALWPLQSRATGSI